MIPYISTFAIIAISNFYFADGGTSFDWAPLVNTGAIGFILAWFLWKDEPRKRAIEDAINRNTRAILILTIAFEGASKAEKMQAQGIIDELDTAIKQRDGK